MRIAVCTVAGAPDDSDVWSGTPSHFMQALREVHEDVVAIGPVAPRTLRLARRASSAGGRLAGKKVHWEAEPLVLGALTRNVERRALEAGADVVVAMGWYPQATSGRIPFVCWTDATYVQRLDVAPHWSRLSRRTRRNATVVERSTLSLVRPVVASNWAAESVLSEYGRQPDVVPFGANIDDPGPLRRVVPDKTARVLSVGVEWHRKGMDTAILAIDALHLRRPVVLDVVGVQPPGDSWRRPYVRFHGRLDKAALAQHYADADIFLLPTRNEPFGIVFGEAAAFGLPVVTSRVGNVSERVEDGVAGVLLEPDATPDKWADAIEATLGPSYPAMVDAARKAFLTRWSWRVAAGSMVTVCERALTDHHDVPVSSCPSGAGEV